MPDCCSIESYTTAAKPAAGTQANCPRCGQPGQPVALETLKHQVRPEHLETVETGSFNFCRTARCEVVYFNDDSTGLTKADVRQRIGLKETEDPVPVCYCFGFTGAMVREEILATGKCTIPQRIPAEVKAGNCACEVRNPQGSCCLGNVNAAIKRVMEVVAAERREQSPEVGRQLLAGHSLRPPDAAQFGVSLAWTPAFKRPGGRAGICWKIRSPPAQKRASPPHIVFTPFSPTL